MGVSLWGVIDCFQFAARQMLAQGDGGNIVVMSSVHAVMAYKNSSAYNTAKAGINHLAKTLANELAPHRIRVNVIEPGWTDTPGERDYATEEDLQKQGKRLPLGRLGTIEDIAKGTACLVSEDGAYATGTALRIDGGFVLPCPSL